jgi:hypothetical protein
MKKLSALSLIIFTLALVTLTNMANAQVAPPAGPSDATTAPPTNASDVGKVLCAGSPISITGPQDASGVDFTKYHWYKLTDASGTKVETNVTGKSYTETPTTPGYYEYMVVTENSNGCTSPISDVYKVYVLPPLSATITSPIASLCSGVGTTVLTANVTPATGYTYTYQWTKGGTPITGATSSTYTVPTENVLVNTTDTYGVTVAYTLNNGCTATATKDILVVPVPTKPTIAFN